MPKISSFPTHRLHIMVERDDFLWLKSALGGEKAISAVLRMLVKRLRGLELENPKASIPDLIRTLDVEGIYPP